ncbi:MAG: arylamine N-acetyltransferase [Methylobacteriaceae bacterium]|nr:arylamine N-acetyltransferase [Methylobacteriaceae bacterium]
MDFEVANHFIAAHPTSPFVNWIMMSALTGTGRISVMNRDLTVWRGNQPQAKQACRTHRAARPSRRTFRVRPARGRAAARLGHPRMGVERCGPALLPSSGKAGVGLRRLRRNKASRLHGDFPEMAARG